MGLKHRTIVFKTFLKTKYHSFIPSVPKRVQSLSNGKMYTSILKTSVVLHLVSEIASQFAAPGQYAFPQMPGQVPGMHMPMVQPGQMPMIAGHPMPLHAPYPMQQQRLPLMVMPYHSKTADRKYKKRKRAKKKQYKGSSSSSSSSESSSSSREYLRNKKQKHRRKKKRQVLTPVISYVTKNGDVVYQKKVKRDSAGDWLEMSKSKIKELAESTEFDSQEMTLRDVKQKYGSKKRHKHKH